MILNYKNLTRSSLLIIVLIILFITCISSVSATDYTINNSTSGGISAVMNGASSGDTIYLQEGIYKGTNNTGLTINKNLVFVGNGSTNKIILDAEKNRKIFTTGSVSVTFINITFLNGYSYNDHGGAIWKYGDLNIIGCNFINNAADSSGGAIYNNQGDMSIIGSYFINNSANYYGGSIYQGGGNLNISDSIFVSNKADKNGNVIYNFIPGNLIVISSNFISNGIGSGTVIYNQGNLTVIGSKFINNSNNINVSTIYNLGGYGPNYSNVNLSYNIFYEEGSIFSNINGNSFVTDYNWFGQNQLKLKWFNNVTVNKWFIVNLTSLQDSVNIGEEALFKYTIGLNDGSLVNPLNLPFFIYVVNGVNYDARANHILSRTYDSTGEKTFSFYVDNQLLSDNILINEIPTPTPTPVPNPTPNETNETNNKIKSNDNPTANAVMKETGIPIIVSILVLLSNLGLIFRRK